MKIQYRVWDKERKIYLSNRNSKFQFYVMPGGYIEVSSGYDSYDDATFEDDTPQDRYVIEQFTDLKDNNGVEIYEGDILESYVDPRIKIKHIVQWSEKHLGWFAKNIDNIGKDKILPGDIQLWVYINNAKLSGGEKIYHVVGNIHE